MFRFPANGAMSLLDIWQSNFVVELNEGEIVKAMILMERVIVYLTSTCRLAFPVKPHRLTRSSRTTLLGSFACEYSMAIGNLKSVWRLAAKAISVLSPPPNGMSPMGYQTFALIRENVAPNELGFRTVTGSRKLRVSASAVASIALPVDGGTKAPKETSGGRNHIPKARMIEMIRNIAVMSEQQQNLPTHLPLPPLVHKFPFSSCLQSLKSPVAFGGSPKEALDDLSCAASVFLKEGCLRRAGVVLVVSDGKRWGSYGG